MQILMPCKGAFSDTSSAYCYKYYSPRAAISALLADTNFLLTGNIPRCIQTIVGDNEATVTDNGCWNDEIFNE